MPKTASAFFNLRAAICFIMLLSGADSMHFEMDAMSAHLCLFFTVIVGVVALCSFVDMRMCIYTETRFLFMIQKLLLEVMLRCIKLDSIRQVDSKQCDLQYVRTLQTAPPLPTEPVSWKMGWKMMPEIATQLESERKLAISSLFQSEYAAPQELKESALLLSKYANSIKSVCVTNAHADKYRRSTVMTFTWCFPAELSDFDTRTKNRVVMRSAYVAFECICVSVASCILLLRAAMGEHAAGNHTASMCCFSSALKACDDIISMIPAKIASRNQCIFTESQWSRLRRQQLPLQLSQGWLSCLRSAIVHRHHICCMLHALQSDTSQSSIEMLRGAERTAIALFVESRSLTLKEPYLTDRQQVYVNIIYNAALRELVQFSSQSLLANAESAVKLPLAGIARILNILSRSGWWAFDKTSDSVTLTSLHNRSMSMERVLTSVPLDNTEEKTALQWHCSLPHTEFKMK